MGQKNPEAILPAELGCQLSGGQGSRASQPRHRKSNHSRMKAKLYWSLGTVGRQRLPVTGHPSRSWQMWAWTSGPWPPREPLGGKPSVVWGKSHLWPSRKKNSSVAQQQRWSQWGGGGEPATQVPNKCIHIFFVCSHACGNQKAIRFHSFLRC